MEFFDAIFGLVWVVRHWRASLGLALAAGGLYLAFGAHLLLGLVLVPLGAFFIFWEVFLYFRDTDQ